MKINGHEHSVLVVPAMLALLAGCGEKPFYEYRCSDEQMQAAQKQTEFCANSGNYRDYCYRGAVRAHCTNPDSERGNASGCLVCAGAEVRIDHTPRIVGGQSLHAVYDPSKCHMFNGGKDGPCGVARCVDCCTQTPDRDILECSKCGLQRSWACTFDEDNS